MQIWLMLVTLTTTNPAPPLHYQSRATCETDAHLIAQDTTSVRSAVCVPITVTNSSKLPKS